MTSEANSGGIRHSPRSQSRVLVRELSTLPPMPSGSVYIPSDFSETPFSKGSWFEDAAVVLPLVGILGAVIAWITFV